MDANSIYTILGTAITVFGSAQAWRFYEKRAMAKQKGQDFMRDECRERIAKLEVLLEKAGKEKDQMRDAILRLTGEVSELRVKVEFLEKENDDLSKRASLKRITTTKKK